MTFPKIDFLYLSEADMVKAGVTEMAGCVDAMETMFKLLKVGDFRMGGPNSNSHGVMMTFPENSAFPNMPTDGPDRRFMAMPAYLGGEFDMVGMKWYGSNTENRQKGLPRSILMFTLNDKDTGAPLAYMSANLLSAYRTGAVPGVGFRHFAKKDSSVVGIVGPGVMSKTAFDAIMAERPGIKTVKIKGRGKKSMDDFIAYLNQKYPSIEKIEPVADIEQAAKDADIVFVGTSSPTGDISEYPYINEAWLKPGAVVCCPAAARFDDDFILNRARSVADWINLYEAWAEEMPYPAYETIPIPAVRCMDLIADGKMEKSQVDDLGDILTGKVPARRDEDEIIIYSVGGLPVEDVAWGTTIYRNALEKGIGTKLNLWDTPELA
ncbi:tyramine oxidase subunit B [uncultured Desulfobacter sp.]|uniref:tyramine oxidase subunit B n=1 Tax=uncultured Desulfobacter sp. TaxID=240139 RepID=UPI0029F50D0E|nr:tyramine oxidase subunit B [uncultured Desulfobacter sp.]